VRILSTLIVAASICGATLAAAWGLQAAMLPPPEHADLVAAHAVEWLLSYRLVDSTFRIGDETPLHGECLQGWFTAQHGRIVRGTVLRLSNGSSLIAVRPHHLQLTGAARGESVRRSIVQLELAGCSRILGPRIAEAAQDGPLRIDRSGGAALGLRIRTTLTRMTLYVDASTYRPVAVRASSGPVSGYGRIRLTRLTPALWHRLAPAT
jgi:hypothetical protein